MRRLLQSKSVRIVASLFVSAAMLWLAVRQTDIGELERQLHAVSFGWIAASLVSYWFELLLRAYRWWRILRPVRALPFLEVWSATVIGYAALNVTPARLGELFRADYLGRRQSMSRLSTVGTIVVERMLDMIVVVLCAVVAVAFLVGGAASGVPWLSSALALTAAATAIGALLLYALATRPTAASLSRFPRLSAVVERTVAGLQSIREPRLLAALCALSVLAWIGNGITTWTILRAAGVVADPMSVVLLIGLAGIALAVPSAPAGLGTLQFVYVTAMTLVGLPQAAGFAASLLVQVFLMGSCTLVGALLYLSASLRAVSTGGDTRR